MFSVIDPNDLKSLFFPSEEYRSAYVYNKRTKKSVLTPNVKSAFKVRREAFGAIFWSVLYGAQEAGVAVAVVYAALRLHDSF